MGQPIISSNNNNREEREKEKKKEGQKIANAKTGETQDTTQGTNTPTQRDTHNKEKKPRQRHRVQHSNIVNKKGTVIEDTIGKVPIVFRK